ncbi:dehydrogenase/reductase SDR family member 11-like [Macrosteles quadrilineatus]|uniref:dehydrogenase/reductase SDR family member 11-like n=1 Tax=Macrosteles quadrilineatus TaxID=74068 RepID=UPI0023E1071D|nr:dehydrogenase/reductase SDR family member 11-like [Macrosteles quadrilineatus]
MDSWAGKVAVVTGASSGIGAAIARTLVHHGLKVVGLARRVDKVQQLAEELSTSGEPGQLYARQVDLRNEDAILEAFAWVESLGGADILVNNAGIFYESSMSEGETDRWRAMFDVNVLAVSFCTREYLRSMEKRGNQRGHIFMINSVAGHLTEYPKLQMYVATKHAVKGMTMCLRRELADKKSTIKVTSISPGPVETEIFNGTQWEGLENKIPILKSKDIAKVVEDSLSASSVAQICEVVMTPIPTDLGVF